MLSYSWINFGYLFPPSTLHAGFRAWREIDEVTRYFPDGGEMQASLSSGFVSNLLSRIAAERSLLSDCILQCRTAILVSWAKFSYALSVLKGISEIYIAATTASIFIGGDVSPWQFKIIFGIKMFILVGILHSEFSSRNVEILPRVSGFTGGQVISILTIYY